MKLIRMRDELRQGHADQMKEKEERALRDEVNIEIGIPLINEKP